MVDEQATDEVVAVGGGGIEGHDSGLVAADVRQRLLGEVREGSDVEAGFVGQLGVTVRNVSGVVHGHGGRHDVGGAHKEVGKPGEDHGVGEEGVQEKRVHLGDGAAGLLDQLNGEPDLLLQDAHEHEVHQGERDDDPETDDPNRLVGLRLLRVLVVECAVLLQECLRSLRAVAGSNLPFRGAVVVGGGDEVLHELVQVAALHGHEEAEDEQNDLHAEQRDPDDQASAA